MNIKTFITVVTIVLTCLSPMQANAQTLKDLFLCMPSSAIPILSEYNRLELIDNQKNNKPLQTRNLMFHMTTATRITDDHIVLCTTKNSTNEIKLLESGEGKVIALITTAISDSAYDSTIEFYDTSWKKLDATKFWSMQPTDKFRKLSFNTDSSDLTMEESDPLFLKMDDRDEAPATVTKTIKWTGIRFE